MKLTRKAFTLVEILIVVAIIALIAAVAIPNMLRARIEANDASAQATLKAISTAIENYASIYSSYPTNTSQLLGATPPYLTKDYFAGTHNGFAFTATLSDYSYIVTALPISSSSGTASFTITTGAVLTEN